MNKKNKIIISSVIGLAVIATVGTLTVNNINAKDSEDIKSVESVSIEDNTEEASEIVVPNITPVSTQIGDNKNGVNENATEKSTLEQQIQEIETQTYLDHMNIPKVVKVEEVDENGNPFPTNTTEKTTESTTVQTTVNTNNKQETTTETTETTTQKVTGKPTETNTKTNSNNSSSSGNSNTNKQPQMGDKNSKGETWIDGFGWVEGNFDNPTNNVEEANLSQYSKDGTMGEVIGH